MGAHVAAGPVSIDEYLSNPAYAHCEYVNGEVVPLNVGTRQHAKIQVNCAYELKTYLRADPGGYVGTELHCRLTINGETRFRLPDVAFLVKDTDPDARFLQGAPDVAVEIRSPEDTITSLFRKLTDYFANGAKLGWVILPEEKSVVVLWPSALPRTFVAGETLDGGDILPGLSIQVSDLFA
jgi:Uma2 family endonuclease